MLDYNTGEGKCLGLSEWSKEIISGYFNGKGYRMNKLSVYVL